MKTVRKKTRSHKSPLETQLNYFLQVNGLKEGRDYEREYRFDPERKWRVDFAFPESRVAIEVEGFGRHQRAFSGYLSDIEKYNELTMKGWALLRFTSVDFRKQGFQKIVETIQRLSETRIRTTVEGNYMVVKCQ